MNVFLYVVAILCGISLGALATRGIMKHFVLTPLRSDRDEYLRIAREAQTDVRLVKALRDGVLDLEELRNVGVLDDADSSPGSPTLTLGEPSALPARKPRFVPNFYKRAPKVANLAPGDEAWVNLGYVDADRRGNPVVYANGVTHTHGSPESGPFGRLRVYEDGTLELGSYVGDVAGSELVEAGDDRYRPVARVVSLDTGETRELQVTDCTQLDT